MAGRTAQSFDAIKNSMYSFPRTTVTREFTGTLTTTPLIWAFAGKGKSEQPGASGTKLIYPLAHKLFPLPGSEELDGEDLRVTYIMRNLLCVLPEEDAARLNRVLAKMENVFLVLEQPIRVVPNKMAAAAQPSETRPERPGTQGSVSADVLTVELEPAAPLGIS